MNVNTSFRFGIEELCMALSVFGKPEVGKGLLYAAFGTLTPADEQGRLVAAGHSLMSRDLIQIREDKSYLADELAQWLDVLTNNDYVIHMNRKAGNADQVLAYFVQGAMILEQSVNQGVVYTLTPKASTVEIITGGALFFGVQAESVVDYPEVELPSSALDKAKESVGDSTDAVLGILRESKLPAPLDQALAEDLRSSNYRGAVMRIENRKGQLVSDKGFLILKGEQRQWFFPVFLKNGERYVRVLFGTSKIFAREMENLIS